MEFFNRALDFVAFLGFSVMLGLYVWLVTIPVAHLLGSLWDWLKGLIIKEGDDDYASHK